MIKVDKESIAFSFMLKEYEMLYDAFNRHSKAVEKTITFFWVFVGAMVSLQGLNYKKAQELSLFNLTTIQLLLLSIIFIVGAIAGAKVIEHRLLYIAHVKSINLIRKWFVDHSEDKDLVKYLFFEPCVRFPPYFKVRRHFFWETSGILLIDSILLSFFITNISIGYIQLSLHIKLAIFFVIGIILLCLSMCYYWKMLISRDKNLNSRLDKNRLIEKRNILK